MQESEYVKIRGKYLNFIRSQKHKQTDEECDRALYTAIKVTAHQMDCIFSKEDNAFERSEFENFVGTVPTKIESETDCAICFTEIEPGELKKCTQLQCKHIFHSECAFKWYLTSPTCPLCRDISKNCATCMLCQISAPTKKPFLECRLACCKSRLHIRCWYDAYRTCLTFFCPGCQKISPSILDFYNWQPLSVDKAIVECADMMASLTVD